MSGPRRPKSPRQRRNLRWHSYDAGPWWQWSMIATVVPMTNPAARLRLRLDAARQRWKADDGGVAVREVVAIAAIAVVMLAAAVAVLEVAGIDVTDWMRERLGIMP